MPDRKPTVFTNLILRQTVGAISDRPLSFFFHTQKKQLSKGIPFDSCFYVVIIPQKSGISTPKLMLAAEKR
ncbi:MAG: hypothetical protein IJE90_04025, partial [Clostridia bacterium]|nr:hypothetical protein [Clostridia bacterium]